jgi:CXXC zinc finger domain.
VEAEGQPGDFRVKLALTVCKEGATVGSQMDDCGECHFCLDKRKFGGPGTKRQKCVLKRTVVPSGPTRVWSSMRVVSKQHLAQLELYSSQPPPAELVAAMEEAHAGVPLVWGFPSRAPRAAAASRLTCSCTHCDNDIMGRPELPAVLASYAQQTSGNPRMPPSPLASIVHPAVSQIVMIANSFLLV